MIRQPGRIMAVDPGDARIGVALSDETRTIVGRAWTVQVRGDLESAVRELAEVARREGVTRLVIGLPRNMDGTEGSQAFKARELGALLSEATDLRAIFRDEALSTWDARRRLIELDRPRRGRRNVLDAVAASVILEDELAECGGASPVESEIPR